MQKNDTKKAIRSANAALPAATILEIRMSCRSEAAMRGIIEILEAALGAADEISRPYENRDGQGKRIYIKFVVPTKKM